MESKKKRVAFIELYSADSDYEFKEEIHADYITITQTQVVYYTIDNVSEVFNYRIVNEQWGNAINGTNQNGAKDLVISSGFSWNRIVNTNITLSLASGKFNKIEHFRVRNETVPGGIEGGLATFDDTHLYKIVITFEYIDTRKT